MTRAHPGNVAELHTLALVERAIPHDDLPGAVQHQRGRGLTILDELAQHCDRLNNRIALLDNERTELSSRLDTIRGICEAAHSMADANNAVEKIARIVEKPATKT